MGGARGRGFTLIEVAIALSIFVLVAGLMIGSFDYLFTVKRNVEANKLAGMIRYLFDRAQLDQLYMRIEFDLEDQSYSVQSSTDPVLLSRQKIQVADGAAQVDEEAAEDGHVSEEEEDEQTFGYDSLQAMMQFEWTGWTAFREKLRRKRIHFNESTENLVERTLLPTGIYISGVYTPHQEDVITVGKVYIHIFPNGWVEPAIIFIEDRDENVVSLRTRPLMGTVQVTPGRIELPDWEEEARSNDSLF